MTPASSSNASARIPEPRAHPRRCPAIRAARYPPPTSESRDAGPLPPRGLLVAHRPLRLYPTVYAKPCRRIEAVGLLWTGESRIQRVHQCPRGAGAAGSARSRRLASRSRGSEVAARQMAVLASAPSPLEGKGRSTDSKRRLVDLLSSRRKCTFRDSQRRHRRQVRGISWSLFENVHHPLDPRPTYHRIHTSAETWRAPSAAAERRELDQERDAAMCRSLKS
jgi:hypothetical protein